MTDDNQDQQPGLPVPTDAGEINNELEGLQEEMADTMGAYWRGPAAQRKQARFRQLVEAQEGLEGGADGPGEAEPVALGDRDVSTALGNLRALGTIGAGFADELGSGAKIAVEAIEENRTDILADMGDTAGDVVMAFEGLPGFRPGGARSTSASPGGLAPVCSAPVARGNLTPRRS